MGDDQNMEDIEREKRRWEEGPLRRFQERVPERKDSFRSISDLPVEKICTPLDVKDMDYLRDLGFPGEYPFTRGAYPTMYRARPWTMRQIAGFGLAEDTNERFRYLIEHGQTGLSINFDMPTLLGYDSDDPMAVGEVGMLGAAVDTVADMERLLKGIPLDEISISMTINGPAPILLAMCISVAEKRGIPMEKLSGTVQNDLLKDFIAQKTWILPVEPSVRLIRDTIIFCTRNMPHYNPVSISGYHTREAGSTAIQEAAFTLAAGITYAQAVVDKGVDFDSFAPRLAFYFNCHIDFFEEIAKFRAARRAWARIARERFGARKDESCRMRFHTQTAGCSLTAQQPLNNIARVAIQALAAVIGGTQSLHTNGMDEALAIPSEEAMRVALRTQQIILEETGVADTIDGLGGSYLIESLTDRIERGVWEYLDKIEAMGGMVKAIEGNYLQREIADAAYRFQTATERGERVTVGMNKYVVEGEEIPFEVQKVDPAVEEEQKKSLSRIKRERDAALVERRLRELHQVATTDDNLLPPIIEAVKAYATVGEITGVLKKVFGTYVERPIF